MNTVQIIKKVKANLIRLRLHRFLGFSADLLIYAGYLLKLSAWIDKNGSKISPNDFYNRKVIHKDREKLYAKYAGDAGLNDERITYIEFGVGRGDSLRWWSTNNKHEGSTLWAFDTYEGLPEKYGTYDVGTFSQGGKFPDIDDKRISFVKGLFQDTLLTVIDKMDFNQKTVVHVDGDLYSAALFPLTILYPYLKKGDVIVFDEFVVPGHEFKAFDDFTKSFYLELEPICAINNYLQVIFEVKDIKNAR